MLFIIHVVVRFLRGGQSALTLRQALLVDLGLVPQLSCENKSSRFDVKFKLRRCAEYKHLLTYLLQQFLLFSCDSGQFLEEQLDLRLLQKHRL